MFRFLYTFHESSMKLTGLLTLSEVEEALDWGLPLGSSGHEWLIYDGSN